MLKDDYEQRIIDCAMWRSGAEGGRYAPRLRCNNAQQQYCSIHAIGSVTAAAPQPMHPKIASASGCCPRVCPSMPRCGTSNTVKPIQMDLRMHHILLDSIALIELVIPVDFEKT